MSAMNVSTGSSKKIVYAASVEITGTCGLHSYQKSRYKTLTQRTKTSTLPIPSKTFHYLFSFSAFREESHNKRQQTKYLLLVLLKSHHRITSHHITSHHIPQNQPTDTSHLKLLLFAIFEHQRPTWPTRLPILPSSFSGWSPLCLPS